ncbi:MAG: PQQ-binding-like beta-propeller repeat protein [Pirellulaceae bacterium]
MPVTYIGPAGTGYEAVNSSGMLYALGNQPIRTEADENPGRSQSEMLYEHATTLSDGRVVLMNSSRTNQLAIVSASAPKIKLLSVNLGIAQATCPPIAVGDKLALGLDSGQLVLVDLATAAIAGTPYQPAVQAGQKMRWNSPAYMASSKSLIAANDVPSLVRLSTEDGLQMTNEVALDDALVGPLAVVGEHVCAVAATEAGDTLQFFDSTNLQRVANWLLPGRLVSGPFATEQGCLLQTDGKLALVSSQGQPLWTIDFPTSPLVSSPLVSGANWNLATQSGQVWVLSASDGQVLGQADVAQPLSSPLLQLGSSLLMGSDEGAVLALPIPTTPAEAP